MHMILVRKTDFQFQVQKHKTAEMEMIQTKSKLYVEISCCCYFAWLNVGGVWTLVVTVLQKMNETIRKGVQNEIGSRSKVI